MSQGNRIQNIDNSSFIGSTVANGDISQGISDAARVVELTWLLHEHRAELVRLGGAKGERVDSRIEEIEEELSAAKPDKAAVSSAWSSVLKVLAGGAAAAESVTKISDAVRSFLGA